MKCEQASALHPLMAPEGVKLLRRFQEGFLSTEEAQGPPEEVLQQVRNVLKLHRSIALNRN